MTLIVAQRLRNRRYAIVADFRISYGPDGKTQNDQAIKFFDAGGRPDTQVGLFAAGSVALWQRAAPLLKAVAHKVRAKTVRSRDAPFLQALNQAAGSHTGDGGSAVVFLVEKDRDRSKVLVARVFKPESTMLPGMVAELEAFPDSGLCILGSGGRLPGLREAVAKRVSEVDDQSSTYATAVAIRDAICSAFDAVEADAYVKYGVSRDMSIGIIEGGHFRLAGEEGVHIGPDGRRSEYELSRDQDTRVTLKDRTTGEAHPLSHIDEVPNSPVDNTIDVQRKTNRGQTGG